MRIGEATSVALRRFGTDSGTILEKSFMTCILV